LQETGEIFLFELLPGGDVVHIMTLPSPLGLHDISGLHFDQQTATLFALYDTHNRLVEVIGGEVHHEYEVAGNDQEGFALIGGNAPGETTVFVAEDLAEVWRYPGYPIDWPAAVHSSGRASPVSEITASPNPFRSRSTIRIELKESTAGTVGVYDVFGRCIRSLADGPFAAGTTELAWDGCDESGHPVPMGVHCIRLTTPTGKWDLKVTHIE
jgi:hypothetical protein